MPRKGEGVAEEWKLFFFDTGGRGRDSGAERPAVEISFFNRTYAVLVWLQFGKEFVGRRNLRKNQPRIGSEMSGSFPSTRKAKP